MSCILLLSGPSESFKILGIFHTFSKSHYIAGGALMNGLAAKGHDVTVISPFPQQNPIENYHDVTVLGMDRLVEGKPSLSYFQFVKKTTSNECS